MLVAAAALMGRPMSAPAPVLNTLYLITGAATGAAITPEALKAAITWPLSLLWLAVATTLLSAGGYFVFRRLGGCDRQTAFFASAPGALTAVLVLGEAEGADMTRVAVAQTLRLGLLAATAPLVLSTVQVPHLPPPGHGLDGWMGWLALAAAALAGWWGAQRLRWPAAVFLGPMAAVALVHATGLVGVTFARPFLAAASAGLGATTGMRFRGVAPAVLLRFLPASLAALAVMAAIGLGCGYLAGVLSGVGAAPGMIAFAPGSMDVMIAVALALGANPAYVAAHHTARFLALMLGLPFIAERFKRMAVKEAA